MNSKLNFLIFGSGFIGRALAAKTASLGHSVHLVDRVKTPADVELLKNYPNCSFAVLNLTCKSQLSGFKNKPDIIILTAAVVGVNNTLNAPANTLKTNCEIVVNVADWIVQNQLKSTVVFTSTSEIYAGTVENFDGFIPSREDIPVTLSDTRSPRFTYAISKIFGESYLFNALDKNKQKLAIVRYHNVYGPSMGFKHVIPHVIQRIKSNEDPLIIYGAEQTRAFCYIDDAVEATLLVANSKSQFGEIYHVGTDCEISIRGLFEKIVKIQNSESELVPGETYPGSVDRRCPDIRKIKQLGYQPKFTLEQGLSATCKWYDSYFEQNENPITDGFIAPGKT